VAGLEIHAGLLVGRVVAHDWGRGLLLWRQACSLAGNRTPKSMAGSMPSRTKRPQGRCSGQCWAQIPADE